MQTTPELVKFACDEVLVDSELIANRVLFDILTRNDATFTFEQSCIWVTEKYLRNYC